MSILFLQIINLEDKTVIGTYESNELNNSSIKIEIETKSKELISQIKTENISVKKSLNFKNEKNGTIDIYYLSTNNGTLYLSFVEVTASMSKSFKDNYIYELLENMETQNIKKFVGDDDKLSNVGLQNLKMSIENYHNTYNYGNESLIDDDPQSHKISIINSQINDVKNDMKENVKNMITNMQDMNEIEGKAVNIKDSSFQFQRDSKTVENKMRRMSCRNSILLFVLISALWCYILYIFMK
jgi:hypothetical protein